jgi:DNA-binding transcriptional ArsR family regulator
MRYITNAAPHIRIEETIMGRPKKINVDEALKLRLKGVSTTDIAKHQGVNQSNVSRALKPLLERMPGWEHRLHYQECQADILDTLSAGILASVTKKDLSRASLLSKVNSTVALIDRSRLIRGQSTSNSISVLLARHVSVNEPAPSTREVIIVEGEM